MLRREKFSEKAGQALSSRNLTEGEVGSEEDAAPEQRGFWDGVDLRVGAMRRLTERERERERERQVEEYQQDRYQKDRKEMYVCMKNA